MFFLVGNGKEKHASAAASGGYFFQEKPAGDHLHNVG